MTDLDKLNRARRETEAAQSEAARAMLAALKEARRFLDYFAHDRTMFVGDGTPLTSLAQVDAAIAAAEKAGITDA